MTTAADLERRLRHSPTYAGLVRGGLLCYGLLHLIVAWVTIRIAPDLSGPSSTAAALTALARDDAGLVAMSVLVGGFAVLGVWQAVAAALGYRDLGRSRRLLMRGAAAIRAATFAYLTFSTARLVLQREDPRLSSTQTTAERVLAEPFGRTSLVVAGLVIAGIGIGLAVFGMRRGFLDQIDREARTSGRRVPILLLGQIGYVAKGVAFVAVGAGLGWAGLTDDATRSGSTEASLQEFAGRPAGAALALVVGLGIGCYGLYLVARAWHLSRRTVTS